MARQPAERPGRRSASGSRRTPDQDGAQPASTPLWRRLYPEATDWGLRNNELDFTAQLVPNAPGIVDGLAKAVALTPSQLAAQGRPGMVVRLTGTVDYADGGGVQAPLSGTTCAWSRSYVMTMRQHGSGRRRPPLQPVPEIAPSDMISMTHHDYPLQRGLRDTAEISDRPFRVVDAEGGSVVLDPMHTTVDTDVFGLNTIRHPNRWDTCLLVEWILPHGQQVTVLGTLAQDLTLVPGPDTALLVTTKPTERVLQRRRLDVARYPRRRRRLTRLRRGRLATFLNAMQIFPYVLAVATVISLAVLLVVL